MMMQQRQSGGGRHGGPGGPMAAMMPGAKAQDFMGTMKKLIAYLGGYRTAILIVFVFAILSTAASIVGQKFSEKRPQNCSKA